MVEPELGSGEWVDSVHGQRLSCVLAVDKPWTLPPVIKVKNLYES